MGVPFMRAYAEQLVRTCHRRGAHAIGGMAAFIPSRRDEEVNRTALARVREDKGVEADLGFDGAWVAHPDLVPVVAEVFGARLGDRPNQKHRPPGDPVDPCAPARRARAGRPGDRGRRPRQRQRRASVPRGLAPRLGGGRHQQPDGGHGHGGDRPGAALAVDPPRHRRRDGTAGHACAGARVAGGGAGGPRDGGRQRGATRPSCSTAWSRPRRFRSS